MAAAFCAALASCSSSADPAVQLGFAPGDLGSLSAAGSDGTMETASLGSAGAGNAAESAAIPLPSKRPEPDSANSDAAAMQPPADNKARPDDKAQQTASAEASETAAASDKPEARAPEADAAGRVALKPVSTTMTASADDAPADTTDDAAADGGLSAKKRSFLSAFFSPAPKEKSQALTAITSQPDRTAAAASKPEEKAKVMQVALKSDEDEPVRASLAGDDVLPGVRKGRALFEITSKSGVDDESSADVYEDVGSYQIASAGGLGRGAMRGMITQREDVQTGCFKPALVRVLGRIKQHYGKPILITSGYRSPEHNRQVHGARKSLHMYCAAADIKVAGVSKWELARYVRSMPGRGGVGTYCHTNAIHVDVGPERDWNWRCSRRN